MRYDEINSEVYDEIDDMLMDTFDQINMDLPSNFDEIVKFIYAEIENTGIAKKDVVNGLKTWMETQNG
tara:strand:+ start:1472 stop:1675 length:204 start_codon:yes stop_codon:yes gene_type:complete